MSALGKALVCAAFCGAVMGCSGSGATPPVLEYTVGGCADESDTSRGAANGEVEISSNADAIHLEQRLTYVCCAELELTLEREGNAIRIMESNVGEICRCRCEYYIEAEVSGLGPGEYDVEVWGVEYEDLHRPELLGEGQVTL